MRIAMLLVGLSMPVAASAQVMPGKWEIVTTVQSVDMPGAPPFVATMMKGKPVKVSQCVTPEQAANGPQEMLKINKQCRFTRYSMAGGKLDSVVVCQQGGGTMTATSSGSFTATGFSTNGRTVMTGPHAMTLTATSVGRRIGECK